MEMSDKDKYEVEKSNNRNSMNYDLPSMSTDWRYSSANIPISLVPSDNPIPGCSSSCSSAPMVNSLGQNLWDQPVNTQNMSFCEISNSNGMGIQNSSAISLRSSIDRPLDMGWNPPSTLLKEGIFMPNAPGMIPQTLAQFPPDSGFIERAARFSSFNGGNFGDMMNPFGIPESIGMYSRGGGGMMQDVYGGNGLKSSGQNVAIVSEAPKEAPLSAERGAAERSPLKNDDEEAKQGLPVSGNDSDEANYSGGNGQNEISGFGGAGKEPSAKGTKKRKRNVGQVNKPDQSRGALEAGDVANSNGENKQKGEQPLTSGAANKTADNNGKQASDPPKEDYIHIRARRGQATNSHSLAERVRREKISERMKFLQDLVPGCSKVTGKAVMLDEIINYVQSLQRQVEFLSMKLATVNPRLDLSIEGLLAKDILHSRIGPSSSLGFPQDSNMAYPSSLHQSHQALGPLSLSGMASPSDILRRAINSQLPSISGVGFKDQQLPSVWEDDLHNVVQTSYVPSNSQDANGSMQSSHMKIED